MFCEMVDDITLLAEPVVQVVVAVVPVAGPFDSPSNLCAIGEFKRYFSGIPAGTEVDEIGEFLGPEVPRAREGKDKEDRIDDVAFTGSVWAGYDTEPFQ
jgi:hypothetical protein